MNWIFLIEGSCELTVTVDGVRWVDDVQAVMCLFGCLHFHFASTSSPLLLLWPQHQHRPDIKIILQHEQGNLWCSCLLPTPVPTTPPRMHYSCRRNHNSTRSAVSTRALRTLTGQHRHPPQARIHQPGGRSVIQSRCPEGCSEHADRLPHHTPSV